MCGGEDSGLGQTRPQQLSEMADGAGHQLRHTARSSGTGRVLMLCSEMVFACSILGVALLPAALALSAGASLEAPVPWAPSRVAQLSSAGFDVLCEDRSGS